MVNKTLPDVWLPPACDLADSVALQALEKGQATPEQQKRALAWIINAAAATYSDDYRADPRDHAFLSGRRFVGLRIVTQLKLNTTKLATLAKTK